MKATAICVFLVFAIAPAALPQRDVTSQPNVREIVEKSVANTQADWKAAPQFSFTERDSGKKDHSVKTYRVMMIDGSPYYQAIGKSGEPIQGTKETGSNRKLQEEISKRKNESPSQREKRISKYERERHQDNALLREMVKAMDFRMTGEETIDGRRCFVFEGSPKPHYQPVSRETKVLTGMRGKMWIDKHQYQWVKVKAEVFRPVTFGLFFAHVEPGTEFIIEQSPIEGNLWLPTHFTMRVKANVLNIVSRNSNDEEDYSDYQRTPDALAQAR